MSDVTTTSRCARCERDLPLMAFRKVPDWCKACRSEYQQSYYRNNRDKFRDYARNRPQRKRPPSCRKCGTTKPLGIGCVNGCADRVASHRPVIRARCCSICGDGFVIKVSANGSASTCSGDKCQTIRAAQNARWDRKREKVKRSGGGRRPYNDPDYRLAKRWLAVNPHTTCWFPGCDALATTIDHVPAIAEHTHVRGTGCCELRPACRSCNCSHGAAIGNRMRSSGYDW